MAAQSKTQQDAIALQQSDAKVKRLEEELAGLKEKAEQAGDLKSGLDKQRKAFQTQIEELQEQLDEAQNARIKAEKNIREMEEEIESLKEKLEEADKTSHIEELKSKFVSFNNSLIF